MHKSGTKVLINMLITANDEHTKLKAKAPNSKRKKRAKPE